MNKKARISRLVRIGGASAVLLAGAAVAGDRLDFGIFRDDLLEAKSSRLFGVYAGLPASSTLSVDAATANADPTQLVTLAKGLRARVVSAAPNLAPVIDQMALWPAQSPTHIIACNEEGVAQPAVQRIRLKDGVVETLLTGMSTCDPIRRTPWGTILAGEEAGSGGQLLEIINPLNVTNVLFDRVTGTFTNGTDGSGAENVALRLGLGRLSWEGLAILPNGIIYYGDEQRPGSGTAGGAYFKFIPSALYAGPTPIANLGQSPLVSGSVYGLRLGKRAGNTDFGQGTQTGRGIWVSIPDPFNKELRAAAASLKLTGYYRPEDSEVDPVALAAGNVRFCAINTGNESDDRNYGEAICLTDGTVAEATANTGVPEVQFFVPGTPGIAMTDNIAFQPGKGNWLLMEDGDQLQGNNDVFSCLEDGADDDALSDGCLRVMSLNDLTAEFTGGFFDPSGRKFYISVQHNVTGHGVVLAIEGWRSLNGGED